MEILIRGDKLKVTEAMNDYVVEKLKRLEKYIENNGNVRANVVIKVKNHEQKVEVTIPLKKFILRAEETQEDVYAAIDVIVDKIEREIKKEYHIDFLIHIDPIDLGDVELKNIKDVIQKIIFNIDESLSVHDVRLFKAEGRLYFDLVLPYSYQSRSKEFLNIVKDEISRKIDYKLSIEINYK